MLNHHKGVEIELIRIVQGKKEKVSDLVAREIAVTIMVNKEELVCLPCSPGKINYLAVGFLLSSGILKHIDDILSMETRKNFFQIEMKNFQKSCLEKIHFSKISEFREQMKIMDKSVALSSIQRTFAIDPDLIYTLLAKMEEKSAFFRLSGGVHSCGLADSRGKIHFFCEDISRYNTIDRIFGEAFLKNIDTRDKIILTSCRISYGIMKRMIIGNVPVVISRSAVTDRAIQLAQQRGITLVGFARNRKMNIYTHADGIAI